MRSRNPIFSSDAYENAERAYTRTMTYGGTIAKTLVLLSLLLITAAFTFVVALTQGIGMPLLIGSGIVAFILVIVTMMKPSIAAFTAPIYAAVEGVLVGSVTASFGAMFDGIVLQAVLLTIGVTFATLILYTTRTIRVTARFRQIVMAMTLGIMITYLINLVFMLFGAQLPFLHEASPLGIGISLLIVAVAAFNLLLDFDSIEFGVRNGLPKNYEWVNALGLLVTLVWLYFEILRLLSLFRER
ncbi:MAG: Bax inhibitor-1/YccA family protein [Bacilli bacterium]